MKSPTSSRPALCYCKECVKKQQKIDRLEERIASLEARLRYQERKGKEEPFGSSTPSSKQHIKASTDEEKRKKRGGAVRGHKGYGRQSFVAEEADEVVVLEGYDCCPDCGGPLVEMGERERTIIDAHPGGSKKRIVKTPECFCANCRKKVKRRVPGVMPRSLFSNNLLSQIVCKHYVVGHPVEWIAEEYAINSGTIFTRLHTLADLLKPVDAALIDLYRNSPVKHADETGWRTDGENGYMWGFFTDQISIFRCRNTRARSVPLEVLGEAEAMKGVLVVDRYGAYNIFEVIQYCYSHLLRDTKDVGKNNPEDEECARFVAAFAPLLADAIRLRNRPIDDEEYYREAAILAEKIKDVANQSAKHPDIQRIQNIFREKESRLFHWVGNRAVPADNNRAERELRPSVIARKISFGSQSERGQKTREILMSVLNTLKKRYGNVAELLTKLLDTLVENPDLNIVNFLLPETIPVVTN